MPAPRAEDGKIDVWETLVLSEIAEILSSLSLDMTLTRISVIEENLTIACNHQNIAGHTNCAYTIRHPSQ